MQKSVSAGNEPLPTNSFADLQTNESGQLPCPSQAAVQVAFEIVPVVPICQ